MLTNNLHEVNVNRWWWLKRWEYNKGLLLSGIISFLIFGFTGALLFSPLIPYILLWFAIAYAIYIMVANILYTLGWVADIALNKSNDDNFREMIFKCGYWISLLAPPIIILLHIVIVFIDIPIIHGQPPVETAKP